MQKKQQPVTNIHLMLTIFMLNFTIFGGKTRIQINRFIWKLTSCAYIMFQSCALLLRVLNGHHNLTKKQKMVFCDVINIVLIAID
jgi:hypothetical protein